MLSSKKQDGDKRFLRVQKDPRFWEMPEREHKIKIDKRFKSMFSDKRFKVKYTVDKRGRPINHTSTEDLKCFYKVSDSEEEEETEKKNPVTEKKESAKQPERSVPMLEGGLEEDSFVSDEGEEEEEEDPSDQDDDVPGSDLDAEEESGVSGSDKESDSDSEPDLARGKGNEETSSDDEEDDVDIVLRREEEEIEHAWGDLCKDAPRTEEVSTRLAVCNMDWDRLKAKDLLVLLNSFTPTGGAVLSVKIYPSEFGKERLKMEDAQGPLELRTLSHESEDDTEEEKVYREKMRDYQFKRLKYFYAVVECDSVSTAVKIYEECDGYEYESSCSCLDLRFIPDDVAFDEEPKDAATDVNMVAYTPKLFTSSGTTTSKVQLTWDETDHERMTAMNRKFNRDEVLDMDFNAYLASSSEEEEDEEKTADSREGNRGEATKEKKNEEQMCKYRELLRGIQEKDKKLQEDKDVEMEITWVPGLKETTEQLVKKKLEEQNQLTPWEEFLQKKKEKKKLKKSQRKQGQEEMSDDDVPADVDLRDSFFAEELAKTYTKKKIKGKKEGEEWTAEGEEELQKQKAEMMLLLEDDDSKHEHFNYDKIVEQQNLSKMKRKKMMRKKEELLGHDQFQVDVNDPRFQAMFTSHLFNLDPSHSSYRNTKATQSILSEKQRRREQGQQQEVPPSQEGAAACPTSTMDPSLSLLVKSIKNKTEEFQTRKKQKLKV
ncbi:ESF1 homolog isoform X2 [Takifugu rubripes]|uniref:ESF1 homolog isoform X2 n=1 Tax=Takifugu rubripes TaxID=31033 RepID=UPI0005D1CC48|nr:ESF1 homolog isoform X2 [Takifugu rubripes]|eukprot:XP_011610969.1 PREDICTED: ESF1 homolog [Takifugu rubripes]